MEQPIRFTAANHFQLDKAFGKTECFVISRSFMLLLPFASGNVDSLEITKNSVSLGLTIDNR